MILTIFFINVATLPKKKLNQFITQCPHHLIGDTKLDSIDKVVDLIRTVSRDISPDSSKDCDCMSDLYKEKENQTDAEMLDLHADDHCNHAELMCQQQNEIERLNGELERQVNNDFSFVCFYFYHCIETKKKIYVFLLFIIVDH